MSAMSATGAKTLRVAVQERRQLLREGLAIMLGREADLDVVGVAAADRGFAALCTNHRPDVVVMELDTDEWDPYRLAERLRRRNRALRIVGLHEWPGSAAAQLRGRPVVQAVVSRRAGWEALLAAVRAGLDDRAQTVIPLAERRRARGPLTARESEVLELVAAGWRSKEISAQLAISPKTVENHKRRIFSKLGVQNQAHAVAVALRDGLLSAEGGVVG